MFAMIFFFIAASWAASCEITRKINGFPVEVCVAYQKRCWSLVGRY